MRYLALLLNALQLAVVASILIKDGLPKGNELWLIAAMIAAPTVSIVLLRIDSGNDWLALLLRRKALEEKLKIEQLKSAQRK